MRDPTPPAEKTPRSLKTPAELCAMAEQAKALAGRLKDPQAKRQGLFHANRLEKLAQFKEGRQQSSKPTKAPARAHLASRDR